MNKDKIKNKLIINPVYPEKGNNGLNGNNGTNGTNGLTVLPPQLFLSYVGGEYQNIKNENIFTSDNSIFNGVYVHWKGNVSSDWLNYNPRIRLLRYKRKRKKNKRRYYSMPVDETEALTTNQTNVNKGVQSFNSGTLINGRVSRWNCPILPFKQQYIDIDARKWFGNFSNNGNGLFPVSVSDWHDVAYKQKHLMTGQGLSQRPGSRKKLVFAFCIVIDDPTNPRKQLMGAISETLIIKPKKGYFTDAGVANTPYYYGWHAYIKR